MFTPIYKTNSIRTTKQFKHFYKIFPVLYFFKKNPCYFKFSNKTSFLLNMFVPVSPLNKLPTKLIFLMKVM